MSHALYSTRLFWQAGRGVAKLRGEVVPLMQAPCIDGAQVEALDYTPEVRVWQILPAREGWREMTADEIGQCDELLLQMVPQQPPLKKGA